MDPFRLVEALSQALEKQDADRLAALLHPNVELRLYTARAVIIGRDDAREWYRKAFASRIVFEGEATPERGDDGSLVARGRIRWLDEGVLRDRPGQWRITFRDDLIATITAEGPSPRRR
jgi:ketosteroid isomerase-like protein